MSGVRAVSSDRLLVMASSQNPQPGLMRNLGRFFGHIVAGAKSDPGKQEVSRHVERETRDTPEGQVTLRRTVIEEIEFEHKTPRASGRASGAQGESS